MNRSGAPGIKAGDVYPTFKELAFEIADPTLNVSYVALSVVGAGVLYAVNIHTDDAVTAIVRYLELTVDGELVRGWCASEAGADVWYWLNNLLGSVAQISKTPGDTLNLRFKESLIIEGTFTATLAGGKKMFLDGYYGEV